VTTLRNDDVVVLHRLDHRFRMHNTGDNTYTAVLRPRARGFGMLHFGVDAMSNGTLFDDTLPYDAQRWVLPFAMARGELDDPMP
jgi:hypothetical protein